MKVTTTAVLPRYGGRVADGRGKVMEVERGSEVGWRVWSVVWSGVVRPRCRRLFRRMGVKSLLFRAGGLVEPKRCDADAFVSSPSLHAPNALRSADITAVSPPAPPQECEEQASVNWSSVNRMAYSRIE